MFYLFFDSLTSLYVISAMFGLFQGGIVPSYAIIVREAMPASEAATRVGIVIFASVFGMSFGGWISGVIFDATGSYAAAFTNGLAWNALNITIMLSAADAGARDIRQRPAPVLRPEDWIGLTRQVCSFPGPCSRSSFRGCRPST